MLDVLKFIFQDFWHFAGTVILLIAICPWNNVKIGCVKAIPNEKRKGP